MIFPFPRWDQWDMLVPWRAIISQHWKIQVGEIDRHPTSMCLLFLEVAQRPLIVCKNWPGFVPGKVWYALCHYWVDNWKQCRWRNSKQGSSNGSLAGGVNLDELTQGGVMCHLFSWCNHCTWPKLCQQWLNMIQDVRAQQKCIHVCQKGHCSWKVHSKTICQTSFSYHQLRSRSAGHRFTSPFPSRKVTPAVLLSLGHYRAGVGFKARSTIAVGQGTLFDITTFNF